MEWTIHGERVVDDSRQAVWSIADVELPSGTRFEQYVYRAPRAAMMLLVVDDSVLMIRRHRWVIDRWVWELPGGYCNDGEDIEECALRELEEETGWRASDTKHLVTMQPWVATADAENHLYVACEATRVDESPRDVNEAHQVAWLPLAEVPRMISEGEIIGSASLVGLQAVLLDRG